jgi:hypothetical protein
VGSAVRGAKSIKFETLMNQTLTDAGTCMSAINHLAHTGQVIYDLDARVYRWRQVMPMALGERELGPPNPEMRGADELIAARKVRITSKQDFPDGGQLIAARVDNKDIEVFVNGEGIITRGKCRCEHHYKNGVRMGPCRHLVAARNAATAKEQQEPATLQNWYDRLRRSNRN